MFQHYNEQITIADITIPIAFFREQEPDYTVPEGAIGREYAPNVEHIILYKGRMVGADLPWTQGDGYLSKVETYRSAWEASQVPPAITLEQAKAQKIGTFDQLCKAEILAGFESTALGTAHRYSAALEDQLNLMGSALLGVDVPYVCTDAEGIKAARVHTAAQMKQVYGDGAMVKGGKIFKFHTLREQVEAASDFEAIALLNW